MELKEVKKKYLDMLDKEIETSIMKNKKNSEFFNIIRIFLRMKRNMHLYDGNIFESAFIRKMDYFLKCDYNKMMNYYETHKNIVNPETKEIIRTLKFEEIDFSLTEIPYGSKNARIFIYSLNSFIDTNFKDFFKDFENEIKEEISKKENITKFTSIIIKESINDIHKRIKQTKERNHNLRTSSSYNHYLNPPMGNNEFLMKTVVNDMIELDSFFTFDLQKSKELLGLK